MWVIVGEAAEANRPDRDPRSEDLLRAILFEEDKRSCRSSSRSRRRIWRAASGVTSASEVSAIIGDSVALPQAAMPGTATFIVTVSSGA